MTAVEWLESELERQCMITVFAWEDEAYFRKLLKQAKEMEKEQIEIAFDLGHDELGCKLNDIGTGEKYYNETYGEK